MTVNISALFSVSEAFSFLGGGIWTVLSMATVAISLIIMIYRLGHYKGDMIFTPFRCIFTGVFVSLFIWWLPIELATVLSNEASGFWDYFNAVMSALHGGMSLFLLEGGVDSEVQSLIAEAISFPVWQSVHYTFGVAMSVIAPLLTFGFILTFFRNLLTHLAYIFKSAIKPYVHVFSELNERSLALAKSIVEDSKYEMRDGKRRRVFWPMRRLAMIVFTDAFEKNEEENSDLFDKARELGAILFKKDIAAISFFKRRHYFYLISENENEELRHAEQIIERYSKYKKDDVKRLDAKVYLFSNGSRGRCFLDSYDKKTISSMALQVVRVNDIRALIYHDLDESGVALFENAKQIGDIRVIRAVIVGLGMYGLEMLKALLWYCQIPGYKVEIKAFDENPEAITRFKASCPEIVLGENATVRGDMSYSLDISCVKVGTQEFRDAIEECRKSTFIFVCLGDDGVNISTSINIRSWLKMRGYTPDIKTVVYNTGLKTRMMSSQSTKHGIEIIGDVEGFYSSNTVINSALSGTALDVHKRWYGENCNPNSLYMYEYGYYSSLANALHRGLRDKILKYRENAALAYAGLDDDTDVQTRDSVTNRYENRDSVFAPFNDTESTIHQVVSLANKNSTLKALAQRLTRYDHYLNAAMISEEMRSLVAKGYAGIFESALLRCKAGLDKTDEKYSHKVAACDAIISSLTDDCFSAVLEALFAGVKASVLVGAISQARKDARLGERGYDFFKLDEDEQRRLFDKVLPLAKRVFDERASFFTFGGDGNDEAAPSKPAYNTQALVAIDLRRLSDAADERKEKGNGAPIPEVVCGERCVESLSDVLRAFEVAHTFATVEHVRWNAYMRTEGFHYFAEKDLDHKMHNNIVPVDELCFSDYVKDL